MYGLTTLVLLASSAIAAKVCFVPSFEKFTLTFDKKKMEGDVQILCYSVEFAEKPTNADLYQGVDCDKDYYVLTSQLLEGSYNDFIFPQNDNGPNNPFKPRLVPNIKQYEVEGTKGKLRALAVTPQKVELNQEVKFDGLFCVQKAEKFDTQDPLKLIKFVASSDLDNSILPFQPSSPSSSPPSPPSSPPSSRSPAPANANNNNDDNNNNPNNQSGVGAIRVCTGTDINCSVSTQTESANTQSSSNAVVKTSGQGGAIIITTSQPGQSFTSVTVSSNG